MKIRRLRTREPTLLSAIEEVERVGMRASRESCACFVEEIRLQRHVMG